MAAGIGDTLRATRRQQRLSLAEAAAEIRVREPYLAALEEEKFAKLGGDVYVRAFLRGYSEFLGLDPDQVVEAYRREHERGAEPRQRPALPSDAPTAALPPTTAAAPVWDEGDEYDDDPDSGGSFFPRAVVLAGVVLLLLVVAVLGLRQRDNNASNLAASETGEPQESAAVVIPTAEVSESPEAVIPSPEPTEEASVAVAPPAPTPPPPSPAPQGPLTELNLELRVVDGPAWLRGTVDGSVAEVGIFEPGTTFTWTADESIVLRIGDASNVRLLLNGVDQGVLGGEREPLDLEYRIGEPA